MFSPAHSTKHISLLHFPFHHSTFYLSQSDNGISNGTTLWLGAQCLSLYLASIHNRLTPQSGIPPKLVELGSGVGLTALVMSSFGWDVLATDIPPVISTVLARNIQNNLPDLPPASGKIQVRELDWTRSPDHWTWNDNHSITPISPSSPSSAKDYNAENNNLRPPFDLICSADTVYVPELVQPLLRTFHALCTSSTPTSAAARAPPVYLCIERRDPALVDRVLAEAHDIWKFTVERIPHRKLVRVMHKSGIKWPKEDWDCIEIWKLTLHQQNDSRLQSSY